MNVHAVSKTIKHIRASDCFPVSFEEIFSPDKAWDQQKQRGLWEVKIADYFIDNLPLVSRKNVGSGWKLYFIFLFADIFYPFWIRCLTLCIPVLLRLMWEFWLEIGAHMSPECWEGFECTAYGSTNRQERMSGFFFFENIFKKRIRNAGCFAVNLVLSYIVCIDCLEGSKSDVECDILGTTGKLTHKRIGKVKRSSRSRNWAIFFGEYTLVVFFFFSAIFDIGWKWEIAIGFEEMVDISRMYLYNSSHITGIFDLEHIISHKKPTSYFYLFSWSNQCFKCIVSCIFEKKYFSFFESFLFLQGSCIFDIFKWYSSSNHFRIIKKKCMLWSQPLV